MTSHTPTDADEVSHSVRLRVLVILGVFCVLALQTVFFYRRSVVKLASRAKPDILLVTFDTLRADHSSAYGYHRTTTLTLEKLAGGGVRFVYAYAPMATTAPSHATMLTSRYPLAHGVTRNGFVLSDEHQTLPEILQRQGYRTAAFVSSFVLFHKFGCAQGFDLYDDDFRESESTQPGSEVWQGVAVPDGKVDRRAHVTTDRALEWLDSIRDDDAMANAPLFLWVHYMDPHEPYDPPSSFGDPFLSDQMAAGSIEQVIARYDTEIAFADVQLARLLERFKRGAGEGGALILVTADHGEAFVEHGWRGHGPQIYEEAVRVPLIVHWAGRISGPLTITSPVGLVDLLPTILGLCGITYSEDDFEGIDLSPGLTRSVWINSNRPYFFQRRLYDQPGMVAAIPLREFDGITLGRGIIVQGQKFGVRVGPWKYLEALDENVPRELYNLKTDPGERVNVAADHRDKAAAMAKLIAQWRRWQNKRRLSEEPQEVSMQDRAALEALGYLGPEPDGNDETDK